MESQGDYLIIWHNAYTGMSGVYMNDAAIYYRYPSIEQAHKDSVVLEQRMKKFGVKISTRVVREVFQ